MLVLLLAYIFLCWSGESVLLKQLEPTNGTPARPGDRIKFLCNTTFSNETILVWGIIDGESTRGFFGNHMNASNGTLKLPTGETATWEAKALHGATQALTSSLTINASSGLHNVTVACCSEHSPSLCSESAATANEFRGMAVIKINSEWDNMDTPGLVASQPKDHTSHYNVVWGAMSSVSLLVCMVALVFQITKLCSTSDKNLWVLAILINATIFAAINTCQMPIYQFKLAETKYCTALGFIFQMNLICTIIMAAVLSSCLYAKLTHLELQSKIFEFYNIIQQFKCIILHPQYIFTISIAVVAVGITVGITITPFVHSCYGDAGGWCWIKPSSNNAGVSCQIMTSSLGLIIALMGFVFAMKICCTRKEDLTTPYNDKYFLTTAVCFLASFLIGNLNSLISRIIFATGTPPFSPFTFFHSTVNPLWPLVTALPSIVQLFIKIWKRGRQQPE